MLILTTSSNFLLRLILSPHDTETVMDIFTWLAVTAAIGIHLIILTHGVRNKGMITFLGGIAAVAVLFTLISP